MIQTRVRLTREQVEFLDSLAVATRTQAIADCISAMRRIVLALEHGLDLPEIAEVEARDMAARRKTGR